MKTRIWLILASSLIIILVASPILMAAEGLTLREWIERAFAENQQYQLILQDHKLSLEALNTAKTGGPGEISLTVNSLTIDQDGLQDDYGMGLGYGWKFPNDLSLTGSNQLGINTQGEVSLTGGVGFGLNLLDFLNSEKNEEMEQKYNEEKMRLYKAKAALIKDVVTKYYQVIIAHGDLLQVEKDLQIKKEQLEKQKIKLDAGLISQNDYYQGEDQFKEAEAEFKEARDELKSARRDFAWIYGKVEMDEGINKELDQLIEGDVYQLAAVKVEDFLVNWDLEKLDEYLENIVTYQEALQAVHSAEKALEQVKNSNQWDISLSGNVNYEISSEITYSAAVGIGKTLYDPDLVREIKQSEIALKRQRLDLTEQKNKLIYDLVNQVETIGELKTDIDELSIDLVDARTELARLREQYGQGYISDERIAQAELTVLGREFAIVELYQQLTTAKLTLGELLCIENYYK